MVQTKKTVGDGPSLERKCDFSLDLADLTERVKIASQTNWEIFAAWRENQENVYSIFGYNMVQRS